MLPLKRHVAATLLLAAIGLSTGCSLTMNDVDRKIERLMERRAVEHIPETPVPKLDDPRTGRDPSDGGGDIYEKTPQTRNPTANELAFKSVEARDYNAIRDRLEGYSGITDAAELITLDDAFRLAQTRGREHRNAEEEYILAAIRLLIERHQWGPRFFHSLTAGVDLAQDNGEFDSALNVINELRATQQLPYGGELEARLLTNATQQLTTFVGDQYDSTSTLELSANIPLLRGAGLVAQEDLIQAERDLIYAARRYERTRRTLLVSIARDYFSLVADQLSIANQRIQIHSLRQLLEETEAKLEAGSRSGFDVSNVEQQLLNSEATLINLLESYRLSVDRFKIRLGLPIEKEVIIEPVGLVLEDPEITVEQAARAALLYRLDYQNVIDQIDDGRRGIEIARNQILPDLDLNLGAQFQPDSQNGNDDLSYDLDDADFLASVTFGLPLDREIERLNLRSASIALQRSIRNATEFRDELVLDARRSVRAIDQGILTVRLRTDAIRANVLRVIQLDIKRDETTSQERIDALIDLLRSQNARDAAVRDLRIAILDYLQTTGQLRVERTGEFEPLDGMNIRMEEVEIPTVDDIEQGQDWDEYLRELDARLQADDS